MPSYPGQRSVAELERQAAAGLRPRRAWAELARVVDAVVVDTDHLEREGTALARAVARHAGIPAAQVCEALVQRGRYRGFCAWDDRLGVPLGVLLRFARSPAEVVLVSDWLSRPKKALLVRHLKAHVKLRGIVNSSSVQREFAASRLGVPREKLHLLPLPVDDRFWRPRGRPPENMICSVGMEARDYQTLLRAVRGLDVKVALAVGTVVLSPGASGTDGSGGTANAGSGSDPASFEFLRHSFGYRFYRSWLADLAREGLPANVRMSQQLTPLELRELYGQARFVVVPLHDVDSDCGMSTITEAMAMGKAVIVSRTRGQVDVVRDGEHGLYVPPGDPSALRSAVEHLLAHPEEADRMGRAGRALVEERHTLDAHVQRLAALLPAA